MTSVRIVRSAELGSSEWEALTDLCVAAFAEPWDGYWQSIGPAIHVLAEEEEAGIVAHAAIVDRLLYPGDQTLQAGYVEAVAVRPDRQGQRLGTSVMERIDAMIDEGYQLGALGTGRQAFYARLGWLTWQGPTWIRHPDGRRERSHGEDGGIMVRRTATTPPGLNLRLPIAVDWRPGEVW